MTVEWDNKFADRLRTPIMKGVVRGTELLRTEVIRLILQTQKTGRVYRRHGVSHQASAPGEPPASDTGALVGSIVTEYEPQNLLGRVVVRAAYALPLEFGTQTMEPRPFMRPAVANVQPLLAPVFVREVQSGVVPR